MAWCTRSWKRNAKIWSESFKNRSVTSSLGDPITSADIDKPNWTKSAKAKEALYKQREEKTAAQDLRASLESFLLFGNQA
jgi:hypothetical protein